MVFPKSTWAGTLQPDVGKVVPALLIPRPFRVELSVERPQRAGGRRRRRARSAQLFPFPPKPISPVPTSSGPPSNNVNETTQSRSGSIRNSTSLGGVGNSSSNSLDVITVSRDVIRIVTQTAMGELEIMRVSPIQVAEGDSVSITPRHLAITLDLSKFGIRESGVLFKVSKPPQQGRLEVRKGKGGRNAVLRWINLLIAFLQFE